MKAATPLLAAAALLAATPARAEIAASSATGFALRYVSEVAASPEAAWAAMARPGAWWDPQHTYSGDAAMMTLVPEPGGCFCETVPAGPLGPTQGAIEHMRVVYAMPGRQLRMVGGLGPLQAEAVYGVLTASFEPVEGGTQVVWEYVVGGYMRMEMGNIAPLVDAVLAQQHARFVASLAAG